MIKFNSSTIRNVRSSGISTTELEIFFQKNQYPSKSQIQSFSRTYQCEDLKIKNWFKGKRDRIKKKKKRDPRMSIQFILNND